MPPLVPATVKAGVVVGLATVIMPPVKLTLVTVPVVGVVQIGTPAPALVNTWPDVPAAVKAYAVPVPYGTAPAVGVAAPFVPPLAITSVPASVTAPVVAVAGVSPVVPPDQLKTPVLLIVTLPVAPDTEMPVPAILVSTPVLATVIVPKPLVTEIPTPVPNVLREYPVPLPINSWPLVGIVPKPVPPEVTGIIPVPVPKVLYRL